MLRHGGSGRDAGAEIIVPMATTFWGDIYGKLRDPFGVTWALGGPAAGCRLPAELKRLSTL